MTPNERCVDASALRTLAAASLFLVAGCAANVTDPATVVEGTQGTVQESSLRPLVVEAVNSAKDCSPLSCCFPKGGSGWLKGDPFEDGLRHLGCDAPAPYTEAAGASNWWFYTECPASRRLNALVRKYAGTPYEAQFITSACLARHARDEGEEETVFVKFDPTCETCISDQ